MLTENPIRMLPGETRKQYLCRYQRELRKKNGPALAEKARLKRLADPEKAKEISKRTRIKNAAKIAIKQKEYREKNANELAEYQKEYRAKNKSKAANYNKDYHEKNRDAIRVQQRQYLNNKLKTNPQFRLIFYLRSRMREAIKSKGGSKGIKTYELLGCSGLEFRKHLEEQFKPEMSWSNYGSYWSVDHISPLAAFDLTKPHIQRLAFHYSNCRPLESLANNLKADRVLQLHELLNL